MAQRITNSLSTVTWAARAMALLFSVAALSQIKLHTIEQGSTIALAKQTQRYTLTRTEFAKRGAILDANGKPLATDESTSVLNVNFRKITKSPAFYMDLSEATGIPATEFATLAESGVKSREWKVPFGPARYKAVQAVKTEWRCDGVSLRNAGRRSYPLGGDASGIVGLVREGQPLMGLELSKNEILKAHNGKTVGFVDRRGQFLPTRTQIKGDEKRNGDTIQTTIDSDLQALAAAAVKQAVELHQADNGVALILDPHNGDLLAVANAPTFQPYQADGTDGDLSGNSGYNPAYMGVLEPGSTFKILTLAKALDEGKTTMDSHFYCSGTLALNSAWRVRCDAHHGNRAHGQLDPTLAIAKSCNGWSATWALSVGRTKFINYVEELGLLRKTKLGLPQETQGLFNYNEYAKPLQLATVGFGQSITTSPIALIGAFGMLANGGVRMEPRLIKKIGGEELVPEEGKRIVKEETASQVLTAMEAVIASDAGTGKSLRIPGYRLGGKTGTAQKIGGGSKGYVANFVGFVPADKPKAVILVMINHPKAGGYYGASVAGPVFVQLAKGVIRHFGLQPTEPL
jgi:cell division protein FtsI/penicillin-binding protein 2